MKNDNCSVSCELGVDPAIKFRGGDFSNMWQSSLITSSLL